MSKSTSKEPKHKCLDGLYMLDVLIGCGSFGKVYKAIHCLSNSPVAIKIADRKTMDADSLERFRLECSALKALRHRNLVQIYEYMETRRYVYLIMEYCREGDLSAFMTSRDRKCLNEVEARYIFRQLVEVVGFLHGRGWSHRDIKPANILLSKGCLKLTDFNLVSHPRKRVNGLLATTCGTAEYAAPELIKGESYIGSMVDIWSMGITLYEITVGRVPFVGNNVAETLKKIKTTDFKIPERLSPNLQDLIKGCLQKDARDRLKMHEICSHPWLTSNNEMPPKIPTLNEPFQLEDFVVNELARVTETKEKHLHDHLSFQPCDYYSASYHILNNHLTREEITKLSIFPTPLPRLKKVNNTHPNHSSTEFSIFAVLTDGSRVLRKESALYSSSPFTPMASNNLNAPMKSDRIHVVTSQGGLSHVPFPNSGNRRHAAFIRHTLQHQQPSSRLLQHSLSIRSTRPSSPLVINNNPLRHLSLTGTFMDSSSIPGEGVRGQKLIMSPSYCPGVRQNFQKTYKSYRNSMEQLESEKVDTSEDELLSDEVLRLPSVLYPNSLHHACSFRRGSTELLDRIEELPLNVTGTSRSLEVNCSQLITEIHESDKNRSFSVNDLDQAYFEEENCESHDLDRISALEDCSSKGDVVDLFECTKPGDKRKLSDKLFSKLGRKFPFLPFAKRYPSCEVCDELPKNDKSSVGWCSKTESTSGSSTNVLSVTKVSKGEGDSSDTFSSNNADTHFLSRSKGADSNKSNSKEKMKKFPNGSSNPSLNLPQAKDVRCVSQVEDMLVCHPKLSIEELFSRLMTEFSRLHWDWKIKGTIIRVRKLTDVEGQTCRHVLWTVYLELCYLGANRSALCLRFKSNHSPDTSGCVEMCYAALLNADLKSPPEEVLRQTFLSHLM